MMNTAMNIETARGLLSDWQVAEPKRALITGGSHGIGAHTVVMLAERSWLVDALTREEFNVALPVRWPPVVTLDALVLCAGAWGFGKHGSAEWEQDFDRQWGYFTGHRRLMEHCLPALRAASGCVIAVASTRAFIGGVDSAPYSVAKAALVCLMQGLAREYDGVRFNAVCPGLTATRMEAQVRASGGAKRDTIAQNPESVASVIVGLIEGGANGKVVRVVNERATAMAWREE